MRHSGRSHRDRLIIKTLSAFAYESPANKPFESAQRGMILRRGETQRISNGQRASSAADAVHVILGMLGKVVIYNMRDAIHVNAARRDVRRDQNPNRPVFEILERSQPLVLR